MKISLVPVGTGLTVFIQRYPPDHRIWSADSVPRTICTGTSPSSVVALTYGLVKRISTWLYRRAMEPRGEVRFAAEAADLAV